MLASFAVYKPQAEGVRSLLENEWRGFLIKAEEKQRKSEITSMVSCLILISTELSFPECFPCRGETSSNSTFMSVKTSIKKKLKKQNINPWTSTSEAVCSVGLCLHYPLLNVGSLFMIQAGAAAGFKMDG